MGKKHILAWEISGVLFIFLFGALFHFIYELSGDAGWAAVVGAVNESTWEHIKIGFWPALIFAAIEFFVFGRRIRAFLFAKAVSFLAIMGLIIVLFYGYKYILGQHYLFLDILVFFIAILVAQIVSYRLMVMQKYNLWIRVAGITLIILQIAAYSLFSYFPPHMELFRDPVFNGYGLL
ncbi:MAG: DUF6512 family protein [Actinomycetota bacterium]